MVFCKKIELEVNKLEVSMGTYFGLVLLVQTAQLGRRIVDIDMCDASVTVLSVLPSDGRRHRGRSTEVAGPSLPL